MRSRFNYHHVVVARPDTAFLSPIVWSPPMPGSFKSRGYVRVPNFAHGHGTEANGGGGVNDRFAYGDRDTMLGVYMRQWELQLQPNASVGLLMHDSESLLCKQLARFHVAVGAAGVSKWAARVLLLGQQRGGGASRGQHRLPLSLLEVDAEGKAGGAHAREAEGRHACAQNKVNESIPGHRRHRLSLA